MRIYCTQYWNLKSYRHRIDCMWYFVFRCFLLYLPFLTYSLNLELFLHKWKILHSKNSVSHRSQPTDLHWEVFPLVVITYTGVKINMARRTGRCFPVYSPSSVQIFLFDGYKLTPPRVWQERLANKTGKSPILRLLIYYERMLAVCKTVGWRDFSPSLVNLHSAQLTSSNRNTKPLFTD